MSQGSNAERTKKLTTIYEQAYFLEVQSLEEKGQIIASIDKYKAFMNDNPKSELSEKAGWNVVELYFKIMDFKGGADAAHFFAKQYPSSTNAVPALLKAAHAYEELADLSKVTQVLLKLSEVDKENGLKWKSLAADFYIILGQVPMAESLYKQALDSKDTKIKHHALVALERVHNKSGSPEHIQTIKKLMSENVQPEASLGHLFLVEKLFNEKKFADAFSESMKLLNSSKEASSYAKAKARFIQAQILEKEFDQQNVKSQIDRFTTVFAIKTEKMDKAQQAYQSAIRYGDPKVAVQSLVQLSKLYEKYVYTLKNMPIPSGLPENEADAFRKEMDKLALPIEEKGVETMAEALNQAKKFNLKDGSIGEIYSELNRMNMQKNTLPKSEIEVPAPALPKVLKKVVGL